MALMLLDGSTGGAGKSHDYAHKRAQDLSLYAWGTFGGETVSLEARHGGSTNWFTVADSTAEEHQNVTLAASEVRGFVTEGSTEASSISLALE